MKYRNRFGEEILREDKMEKIWKLIYGNPLGRSLVKPFCAPAVSRLLGTILDSKLSVLLTIPYKKIHDIDMEEYKSKFYESFNAFFSREIKEENRPIDGETYSLISPADGKMSVYSITEDCTFQVKNSPYSIESLLKSKELAQQYQGGTAIVVRLAAEDYHHYCYAAEGLKGKNHFLEGDLHVLHPVAMLNIPVYKENAREFCRIRTKYFGEMVQMEVGAMFVGRISNRTEGIKDVEKGEEKGHFEYGGSTVILLLEKDCVELDEDLIRNSQQGIETLVKMGERIGYRKEK